MKYTFIVALVILVSIFQESYAQESETMIHGYGSIYTIIDQDYEHNYDFKWVSMGLTTNLSENIEVFMEYNLWSNNLDRAYVRLHKQFGNFTISGLAGKFLGPVPYLYPGPSFVQTTRWPITLNSYDIYNKGIGIWIQNDDFLFRFSQYENNNFQTAATYKDISLFWQSNIAYGAMINFPYNFKTGISIDYKNNTETAFIKKYTTVYKNVRLYSQLDIKSFNDLSNNLSGLVGLTWTIHEKSAFKKSFLKLYYDWSIEAIKVEITFAF